MSYIAICVVPHCSSIQQDLLTACVGLCILRHHCGAHDWFVFHPNGDNTLPAGFVAHGTEYVLCAYSNETLFSIVCGSQKPIMHHHAARIGLRLT